MGRPGTGRRVGERQPATSPAEDSPSAVASVPPVAVVEAMAPYEDSDNGRITCRGTRGHGFAPVRRNLAGGGVGLG